MEGAKGANLPKISFCLIPNNFLNIMIKTFIRLMFMCRVAVTFKELMKKFAYFSIKTCKAWFQNASIQKNERLFKCLKLCQNTFEKG